jgi:hypothetical protein
MKYGAVFTLLLENFVNMPILCHFAVNILQTPLSEVASLLSEVRNILVSFTAVHCNVEVLQNTVMGKSVGSIDSV